MTEKFTFFSRALCAGLCTSVMLTSFFKPQLGQAGKMSLFFPQLVLGGAMSIEDESEDEIVSLAEEDTEIEYTFFIFELFDRLFE